SLGQCKNIEAVGIRRRRLDVGLSNQASRDSSASRQHGNVLLTVDRICDRAVLNTPGQHGLPENFSIVGIYCPEISSEISPKNMVARRGEGGAIARRTSFKQSRQFARRHIDLRHSGKLLWIGTLTSNRALAIGISSATPSRGRCCTCTGWTSGRWGC